MITIFHLIMCLIGIGYAHEGIIVIRNKSWTFKRRKHVFSGLEEVTETGKHLIPIGLAHILGGMLFFFSALSKWSTNVENPLEYLATFLYMVVIFLIGAFISDYMKRRQ